MYIIVYQQLLKLVEELDSDGISCISGLKRVWSLRYITKFLKIVTDLRFLKKLLLTYVQLLITIINST